MTRNTIPGFGSSNIPTPTYDRLFFLVYWTASVGVLGTCRQRIWILVV
ncbi:MAG: hypothetical protein ACRC10_07615 [Thermoguttaceae bacterium]